MRIKLFEGYFSDKRKEIEDKIINANKVYDISKKELMDEIIEDVRDNIHSLLDEFSETIFEYTENYIYLKIKFPTLPSYYKEIDKFSDLEWGFINRFDLEDFRFTRSISFKEKGSNTSIVARSIINDSLEKVDSKELKKMIDKYKYKSVVLTYSCAISLNWNEY
jgi:hypothetical protein